MNALLSVSHAKYFFGNKMIRFQSHQNGSQMLERHIESFGKLTFSPIHNFTRKTKRINAKFTNIESKEGEGAYVDLRSSFNRASKTTIQSSS